MMRVFFLFFFLLVNYTTFAQSRFMAGVSVNPNLTLIPNQNYTQYTPAFSLSGGANFGLYMGKRFLLLTGIERTSVRYTDKGSYLGSNNAAIPYENSSNHYAWQIPLLANYIITNKNKRISFFVTAGILTGRYTSIKYTDMIDGVTGKGVEKGREVPRPYYQALVVGGGCKINLNEKLLLLVIPDYNYTETNGPVLAEVRTVLMYNF